MRSKNKPAPTKAEAAHIALLAGMSCVVCGTWPVEVHEPEQGLWFAAVPLCVVCHRDPVYGWHGQRRNFHAKKWGELDMIAATVRKLMESA